MPDEKLYKLVGAEIFATGINNGTKWTADHLDQMIANEGKAGFQSPLKQGHSKDVSAADKKKKEIGAPALGYVKNLRRVGTKLLADFVDMPKNVYDAIKRRSYGTVSSEIYTDYVKSGKDKLGMVLKAVALLGAEIPGVNDLKPLTESNFGEEGNEWKEYTIDFDIDQDADIQKFTHGIEGIKVYVGTLVPREGQEKRSSIAYIDFAKKNWDVIGSQEWLARYHFYYRDNFEDKTTTLRFSVRNKELFAAGSIKESPLIDDSAVEYTADELKELNLSFSLDDLGVVKAFAEPTAATGVSFVIGKLTGESKMTVQSIVFNKESFKDKDQCVAWLKEHSLRSDKVDETDAAFRYRQKEPGDFEAGSFRTIKPGQSSRDKASGESNDNKQTDNKDKGTKKMSEKNDKIDQKAFDDAVAAKEAAAVALKASEEKIALLTTQLEAKGTGDETPEMERIHNLQKEMDKIKVERAAEAAEFADVRQKNGELQEARRQERITSVVDGLKFPAMRPFVQVFMDVCTSKEMEGKVVKFSADGSAPVEKAYESVAVDFIAQMNLVVDTKIFTEHADTTVFRRLDIPQSDDPRDETDKRIKRFQAEHPEADYGVAMKAVFAADPDLKVKYSNA